MMGKNSKKNKIEKYDILSVYLFIYMSTKLTPIPTQDSGAGLELILMTDD